MQVFLIIVIAALCIFYGIYMDRLSQNCSICDKPLGAKPHVRYSKTKADCLECHNGEEADD